MSAVHADRSESEAKEQPPRESNAAVEQAPAMEKHRAGEVVGARLGPGRQRRGHGHVHVVGHRRHRRRDKQQAARVGGGCQAAGEEHREDAGRGEAPRRRGGHGSSLA